MENATKALMIAGAVLIAIMIIGIGMMIYGGASETITDSMGQIDQVGRDAFNKKLLAYEGKIKGSQLKNLYTEIISLNTSNKDTHTERLITVNKNNSTKDPLEINTGTGTAIYDAKTNKGANLNLLSTERTKVIAGQTYGITLVENDIGYITEVLVTYPKE